MAVGPGETRKSPKRAKPPTEKRVEDTKAAAWFDAGVAAYGSATAYETAGQIDKGDLSNMRVGKIAVALRRLLPMQDHAPSALAFCEAFLAEVEVAEHPDQVLSLVAPLLDAIGYVARPVSAPTFFQLASAVLADLDDGSAITRKLIENAAAKRGWSEAQVAMALRNEGEDK